MPCAFPIGRSPPAAREVLHADLLADKRRPGNAVGAATAGRFLLETSSGETQVRVPISYLIKLALADVVDDDSRYPGMHRRNRHAP